MNKLLNIFSMVWIAVLMVGAFAVLMIDTVTKLIQHGWPAFAWVAFVIVTVLAALRTIFFLAR